MVLTKTILILEDDLETLSKLLNSLRLIEQDQPYDFSLIILTTYKQVEDYINNNPKADYDIALIDRDCKMAGSFHVIDIERFGVDKVIAISSVPEYNEQLKNRGVTRVVHKDYKKLDEFAKKASHEVEDMITPERLKKFINKLPLHKD